MRAVVLLPLVSSPYLHLLGIELVVKDFEVGGIGVVMRLVYLCFYCAEPSGLSSSHCCGS